MEEAYSLKQKEKKKIVRQEKNASVKRINKNHKIFLANQVRLDINPEKARIVFLDESLKGISSFEIEMTKKDWLLILDKLTEETLFFLLRHNQKFAREFLKQNPSLEMMFR
jgi:hypothetical protein